MPEITKLKSTLKDVPLGKMRVANPAQRIFIQSWADYLSANFDPEDLGYPVVSYRGGHYYVVDGQHRVHAVKIFLGKGWETQSITCRTYTGLNEQDEAKMFDRLNTTRSVSAFDRFKVRVTAGALDESAVKKIVEKCGLTISRDKGDGRVGSVTTLVKIYRRANGPALARTLIIIYNSFGDPGLTNQVLDGIARVCERYNGALDDGEAIEKLKTLRGGIGALMARAAILRKQTGVSIPECIAAAAVDTLNAKKGGKKLPSWWKE